MCVIFINKCRCFLNAICLPRGSACSSSHSDTFTAASNSEEFTTNNVEDYIQTSEVGYKATPGNLAIALRALWRRVTAGLPLRTGSYCTP